MSSAFVSKGLRSRAGASLSACLLAAGASGCAVVGSYDFEGYALRPATSGSPDGGASDAPVIPIDGEDATPACVPRTCAELGAECGRLPNGCDDALDCGACE